LAGWAGGGKRTLTAKGVLRKQDVPAAARARTSRAVLYRRWPNRPELVVAALRHHTDFASTAVPDTLRGDALALLQHMSARVGEVAGVLSFLIADFFDEVGLPPAVLRERAVGSEPGSMQVILDRAAARGEIDPGRLSLRTASLPVDLVRHDLIMTKTGARQHHRRDRRRDLPALVRSA